MEKIKNRKNILFILLAGTVLRIILAGMTQGHPTDINCFMAWADRIVQTGCGDFYSTSVFTDYPPGYMYILWVIGKIRQVFDIQGITFASLLLIKFPAILCDLAAAILLWKVSAKKNEKLAIFLSMAYLFNPVIILNSAIWGQVDSVFVLCVILACYLVSEGKLPASYFAFALGILMKPQALIFTPVILYGVWNKIFEKGSFCLREFSRQAVWALGAVLTLFACMAPFGLNTVINQYITTMVSYPYVSVNAYNLWNLLGLNWVSQETLFLGIPLNKIGSLAICATLVVTTFLWTKGKKEKGSYYISGALIIGGMFAFSVRMHERYLYPILILLLMAYAYEQRREWLISYVIISIAHFINVCHVLNNGEIVVGGRGFYSVISSILLLCGYFYFLYSVYCIYVKKEKRQWNIKPEVRRDKDLTNKQKNKEKMREDNKDKMLEDKDNDKNKDKNKDETNEISIEIEKQKLAKKDYLIILAITLVYAVIAFYNLGNKQAPSTFYNFQTEGEEVVFDLGTSTFVSKMDYFLGNYESRSFRLEIAEDVLGPYQQVSEWTMESVFAWDSLLVEQKARYFKIISQSEKAGVGELIFYDSDGNIIQPVEYKAESAVLLDEAYTYDGRRSYHNSTYFDEIYHARTAYEYINGLYSYENTHPPLGKIFIAAGVELFGMNPFGWRFMGTLFGVLMVPIFYLFVFKIFGSSFLSTAATLLFAFDFMHFTQSRIATIDVFVTLFIILMYFFLFMYLKEKDKSKNKKWLCLSGISMGLGVACKWTGAYAGMGLAVIFFLSLWLQYRKETDKKTCKKEIIRTCLWCVLFFVAIPLAIYTLSYIPFQNGVDQNIIGRMLQNQQTMLSYHSAVDATHPYSSWWYQWPTMFRPIWYYSGTISDTVKEGISAFGNPLVWWVGIPAFFYCAYQAIRKKEKVAGFLCIAYLAQYLPWFFVTRITFIYHYFPSVPFVVLMITYVLYQLLKENGKSFKKYIIIYTLVTVALFVLFYPVLSGMPVSVNYVSHFLRWFDSWVLI